MASVAEVKRLLLSCVIATEVNVSVLPQTVKQMWPFICQFVDKLFRDTIEPAVKGANAHLSSFCFTKIDMGQKVTTPRRLQDSCDDYILSATSFTTLSPW